MDYTEAAAAIANPDIKINSLNSFQISGSFQDETLTKESMVRSRSGSSSSQKLSIELHPGLAAAIPGLNTRRASASVRHRSPHSTQERYMPYNTTSPRSPRSPRSSCSPRSPISPRASTSPFLIHSPLPSTSPALTNNFSSAAPTSSSLSYATHNAPSFGSPSVQSGPARSPPRLQSSSRQEQQTPQHQQEQDTFGRHLHRHNSSEGTPVSKSWTGRSLSSASSARSPSSYPQPSHFPPSWSLPPRQASHHDRSSSHSDKYSDSDKHSHSHRHEPLQVLGAQYQPHNHHPASQYHSTISSDHQEAEINTKMSQDYPEKLGYRREDEESVRQQRHLHHFHHSHQHHQQKHHHQSCHPHQQQVHHQTNPGKIEDRYQDLRSEHSTEQVPQYLSTTSQDPTSMHVHHSSSSSSTARSQFSPFPQPVSSNRRPLYGPSRTPSSASSTVSGSLPVQVSLSSAAASIVRTAPAGSTTSSVTVTTTASGEIKTTRRRRRPNESYSTIIIKAIRNSPLQRLKLSEIYDYVSREIPTMDGNDKGWQNTVRHNLSHNKCFRRIVIKDEGLASGPANDDDGESKQSANGSTGKPSKQVKRGKGGCWVLVPENLEESMNSSRPKKSLTDQGQSPAAPGTGSGSLSSTSPKRQYSFFKSTAASTTGTSCLSPQLSKECARPLPNSSVIDIDRNVASMMIAEQQLQQSGRHHGPHMHSSHYSPPHPHSRQLHPSLSHSHSQPHHQQHHGSYSYLPPRYPSTSLSSPVPSSMAAMNQPGSASSAVSQPGVPISHPSQLNYSRGGDDKDHDSESDDGQSGQSDHSTDRDIVGEDYEGDEMMEDDFGSQSSSSHHSPSRSPSTSSLFAASSSMDIEETDGGDGELSPSSSPITGRRPGMSIQNMLN